MKLQLEQISDSTDKLFTTILSDKPNLLHAVSFKLYNAPNLKELYKIIKRDDLAKIENPNTSDVTIYINEDIFDKLEDLNNKIDGPDYLQKICLEEILTRVSFDSEKDIVAFEKPDVVTFSTIIEKFEAKYWAYFYSTKAIIQSIADKKEEEKIAKATLKSENKAKKYNK